jgi:signal peptidase II
MSKDATRTGAAAPGEVPPAALPPDAARSRRLAIYAYALAASVVVLDQLSKWWILQVVNLPARQSVPVLPFFSLTYVPNLGVSFGLLKAHSEFGRWGLVAFSACVVVALAISAWRVHKRITAAAIGLIMGGALGNNIIDRARLGAVTDFLDFTALHFPWVFNVADSAINIGVVLLLAEMLLSPKKD